ncbi:MAG: hypothetical protein KTR14_01745 [Vampirovibrio sp.]|nr:hypothetical protein [Vampirovibrio sp.]
MADEEKIYYESWWFEWILLAVCLAGCWLLWTMWLEPGLDPWSDPTHSVLLAKSLLAGQGLHLSQLPAGGEPLPFFNHPPFYPILLAGMMKAYGTTDIQTLAQPFKYLNFGLYALSVMVLHAFISKRIRKPFSFMITVLYAIAPPALYATEHVMPDIAYILMSLLAIYAVDRGLDGEGQWQSSATLFLVILAVYTHLAGFALLIAYAFLSLKNHGLAKTFVSMAVVAVSLVPWVFLEQGIGQNSPGFKQVISRTHSQQAPLIKQAVEHTETMLQKSTNTLLGTIRFNYFDSVVVRKLNIRNQEIDLSQLPWIRWVVGGLMAIGLLYGLYMNSGIAALYMVTLFILGFFVDPPQGVPMTVVLPFLIFFTFYGLIRVGDGLSEFNIPFTKAVVTLLIGMVALGSLSGHFDGLQHNLAQTYKESYKGSYKAESTPEPTSALAIASSKTPINQNDAHQRALGWINTNLPPKVAITTPKPRKLSLFTGRVGQKLPTAASQNKVLSGLLQSQYILEEQSNPTVRSRITPILEANANRFRLVYNDQPGNIRIWQVLPRTPQVHQ